MTEQELKYLGDGYVGPDDWTETRKSISLDSTKFTSFELGLPDTIEKVIVTMGGRTVEFDVNNFMDMLESFK